MLKSVRFVGISPTAFRRVFSYGLNSDRIRLPSKVTDSRWDGLYTQGRGGILELR
jgi:hypothetical protein